MLKPFEKNGMSGSQLSPHTGESVSVAWEKRAEAWGWSPSSSPSGLVLPGWLLPLFEPQSQNPSDGNDNLWKAIKRIGRSASESINHYAIDCLDHSLPLQHTRPPASQETAQHQMPGVGGVTPIWCTFTAIFSREKDVTILCSCQLECPAPRQEEVREIWWPEQRAWFMLMAWHRALEQFWKASSALLPFVNLFIGLYRNGKAFKNIFI